MTVLIDAPIWWHDGRRWAHLISDESYAELHDFAAQAGIPRRGFHADHYDVPEEWVDQVIAAGAERASSREVLRRLRASGLRVTPAQRRNESSFE